jgi:hypothetical protein
LIGATPQPTNKMPAINQHNNNERETLIGPLKKSLGDGMKNYNINNYLLFNDLQELLKVDVEFAISQRT